MRGQGVTNFFGSGAENNDQLIHTGSEKGSTDAFDERLALIVQQCFG